MVTLKVIIQSSTCFEKGQFNFDISWDFFLAELIILKLLLSPSIWWCAIPLKFNEEKIVTTAIWKYSGNDPFDCNM